MMFMGANGRTEVKDIKELKCPEEGGTKQQYDDFLRKVKDQIGVGWMDGELIVEMIESRAETSTVVPADLDGTPTESEKAMWLEEVKLAAASSRNHKDNKKAFYTLLFSYLSKATRTKVEGSDGYNIVAKSPVWLLSTLDDIMMGFEKISPSILAMDDQMCRIASLKQKESESNDDFVNSVRKEVKVYTKHGGKFLWGSQQDKDLESELASEKAEHKLKAGSVMSSDEEIAARKKIRKNIENKILAMAILKRADKKR